MKAFTSVVPHASVCKPEASVALWVTQPVWTWLHHISPTHAGNPHQACKAGHPRNLTWVRIGSPFVIVFLKPEISLQMLRRPEDAVPSLSPWQLQANPLLPKTRENKTTQPGCFSLLWHLSLGLLK